MTQEFHLSVTPVGQNDYLVRTEQVAPGVPLAEELVTWPVAEWLTAAGYLMDDPLQSLLQGDALARNSVNLVELGQQLYNALFQGTLRDSWITAQGIAQNHQQVLRLRLGLKDTRLARLPWEVMHAGDRPLATGPYIAFSRYQSGIPSHSRLSAHLPTPDETGGIKVLMIISAPTDQTRLDLLKQEAINLQTELQRQPPKFTEFGHLLPEIELTILDQPGREELTQALEQGRYHILHYSGHSNVGGNGGEIYLVSRRTGLTETLSGDDLAGLLVNNNIQIAVFNSCLGAYTANSQHTPETGERNLTESLVKRGVSGVLAMSERIPDEVALTLTQLFYRNLSQGYPLDLCVSRVRQGLISAYGSHQMYWALPILYLQREFDGFLASELDLARGVDFLHEYHPPGKIPTNTNNLHQDFEDMIPSGLSQNLDWSDGDDVLGDIADEIEYDDPAYQEASEFVADLFRQLGHPPTSEAAMSAELVPPLEEGQRQKPASDLTPWKPPTPPTPKNNGLSTQAPPTEPPRRQSPQWPIWGTMGLSAIAVIISMVWLWNHRVVSVNSQLPQIPTNSTLTQPTVDVKTAPTGIVTATASEKLSQGNLEDGLKAVEELLNRGAFPSAEAALNMLSSEQANHPEVNFLRGRLAWQMLQTGDKKYSIDDVRRFWEVAVKAKPDSVEYNNALGFAYYAENNLNRANDAWFKALNLAFKTQNMTANSIQPSTPPEALTAYAGLALGLYKSADSQPGLKQVQYMNEAVKLRQLVMQNDPENFTVDRLAKNWLWTEQAIVDWRSLMQKK